MYTTTLHGKRILITAGPTWVPIDAVRHIGNFATGRLGLVMAREAVRRGAAVTLLLGPTSLCIPDADRARIEIVPYTYFEELHALVRAKVGSGEYAAFLHSAAVSDYAPVPQSGKIRSGQAELVLRLRPLPKIVDEIKRLDPDIVLVKFKLEVNATREELLRIAEASRVHSQADLIVVNERTAITESAHPALILGSAGILAEVGTKEELAQRLLDLVAQHLAAEQQS